MLTRFVGTLGGFLLGAALSNALTLVSSSSPSDRGIVLLTLLFAVAGSASVAAHAIGRR